MTNESYYTLFEEIIEDLQGGGKGQFNQDHQHPDECGDENRTGESSAGFSV
jgi:hypothetical protein